MSPAVFMVHLGLAITLFVVVNWLGSHAGGFGYRQLTVTATADEAPAFNLVFRVAAPLVGLSVAAALLYASGADRFVYSFYLVSIYYVAIRIAFVLATGRGRLLNWPAHLAVSALIVAGSWFLYTGILRHRRNVLPDLDSVANEFWLLVVLFIFQTANRYRGSTAGTERRKRDYARSVYEELRARYGRLFDALTDHRLQCLAYAIAIYEAFNRPSVYRWLERNLLFALGVSRTLGIMQVATDRPITDYDSVRLGIAKIAADYKSILDQLVIENPELPAWVYDFALHRVAAAYNRDDDYVSEVMKLYHLVRDHIHVEHSPQVSAIL